MLAMYTIWQDLRYGLRILLKHKGFTITAVFSLALGIGANTAIFSAIDALLLKELPVRNPEQLVALDYVHDGERDNFSYPVFERLRIVLPTSTFANVSAVRQMWQSNVAINGPGGSSDGGNVLVGLVSGNYFSTLGVNTIVGRVLTADDDRVPGGHPVTVISYDYWKRRLGLASDVVGRTLKQNGVTYTIVGVTQPAFSGDWIGRPTDLWIPMAMAPQVNAEHADCLTTPNQTWVRIIARLSPGATLSQAQAASDIAWRQALTVQSRFGGAVTPRVEQYATGYSPERDSFTQPLVVLMVVVGLVLLIACANIATLLLARSSARRKELAVRVAMGAGRARLVRQLLTESVLLSLMGGLLGLLFAVQGTEALVRFLSTMPPSNYLGSVAFQLNLRPDARVLAFTAAICLLTSLLFGLAPAYRSSMVSLTSALGGRSADSGSPGRLGLGKGLVVSQVALSLLLLVGAGLFVRTLRNLRSQELGFDREHILLIWTWPGQNGWKGPELANYYQRAQERISALPGVLSASPSMRGLLRENTPFTRVRVPGLQLDDSNYLPLDLVAPRFFETVGMRLLLGRDFAAHDDEGAPHVAILNQYTAHLYFGDQNPIGKTLEVAMSGGPNPKFIDTEVIGVVNDIKGNLSLRETDRRMIYFPYRQDVLFQTHPRLVRMCLTVRVMGDPARLKASIRDELSRMDPNLSLVSIDSVGEQLDEATVQERLIAALSASFAALGVLLACLGLYGLVSYTVAHRTNELGIRLALGATPASVMRMVLKESLVLVLVGIVIGFPVILAVMRLISSWLFGVGSADPLTIAGATLFILVVAAMAALMPARYAARVDPLVALRYE